MPHLVVFVLNILHKRTLNFSISPYMQPLKIKSSFRYLATGMSFKQLSFQFMRGDSTIGKVIENVCDSIWSCLREEYMPVLSELQWIERAYRFDELCNLPNCIGSIDGNILESNAQPKVDLHFIIIKVIFRCNYWL